MLLFAEDRLNFSQPLYSRVSEQLLQATESRCEANIFTRSVFPETFTAL